MTENKGFKHIYIVPIIQTIWYPVMFVLTYFLSVIHNDINPFFPYASDTGTWHPASGLFSLAMNVGAFLMGLTVYVRYLHVKLLIETEEVPEWVKEWNLRACLAGIVSVTGVSVLGNFQEIPYLIIHITGAGVAFGFGSLYQMLQTRISFLIYPKIGCKKLNILRLCLAVISNISSSISGPCMIVFLIEFNGKDLSKAKAGDGGYLYHLISAPLEWILICSSVLYVGLHFVEFRTINFTAASVSLKPKIQTENTTV